MIYIFVDQFRLEGLDTEAERHGYREKTEALLGGGGFKGSNHFLDKVFVVGFLRFFHF